MLVVVGGALARRAGDLLSFGGLACAPAAAFLTWGVAGLLWACVPVGIVAGRALSGGG